jgi:hypothetical protein
MIYTTEKSRKPALQCDNLFCRRTFHPRGYIWARAYMRKRAALRGWDISLAYDFCSVKCKEEAGKA